MQFFTLPPLSRNGLRLLATSALVLGLAACGDTGFDDEDDAGETDAGMTDTGGGDTGMTDTGMTDTGEEDTGMTDTGEEDTGMTDTGEEDTGMTDTGADAEMDTGFDGGDVGDVGLDIGDVGDVGADVADVGGDTGGEMMGLIFGDDYADGVEFAPFGGSANDVSIDTEMAMMGDASLRIVVPAAGYTGGALVASETWDVSGYDSIGFWARADAEYTFNAVGVGNDSADNAFQVERRDLALTDEWQWFVLPIGDPAMLTDLAGLFHFAEGAEAASYTVWLDDIQYMVDEDLGAPAAAFGTAEVNLGVDETTTAAGFVANYPYGDETVTVYPSALHFMWMSDDEDVATVEIDGVVTTVGEGTAVITATFAGEEVGGMITVNVSESTGPSAAPEPETPEREVIASLFSDAYDAVTVDTFRTEWSVATFSFVDFDGNAALRYSSLSFAGIEAVGDNSLDLGDATHVHFDVYSSDATTVRFKIVDWGADNAFTGDDNTEGEIAFVVDGDPAFVPGEWNSYDIPLDDFVSAGLANRANVSQFVVSAAEAGVPTVYFDNIYFYTVE